MLPDKFIKITSKFWNHHLTHIRNAQDNGNLLSDNNSVILFPNIALFTFTKSHYIAELLGASREFTNLTIKRHSEISTERYLNQFDDGKSDPCMHLDSKGAGFSFLCLAQDADFDAVSKRFPIIDLFPSKLNRIGGKGSVFTFGKEFESCYIENSVLINRKENAYRCKHILELIIVKKGITKNEYMGLLNHIVKDNRVKAIHVCSPQKEEKILLAGQLQNLYLFPQLRETTIGDFINKHPQILKEAFKTDNFYYEPSLQWIEGNGNENTEINPDLLIKGSDGYYDIYDLKTAALDKKSLTKGNKRRRRFIDYVEEGAAQLAHYRHYFDFEKNRDYAKQKYEIEVKNPKLVLIVGSFENAKPEEIEEAKRRYRDIDIIDYDTVVQIYLGAQ